MAKETNSGKLYDKSFYLLAELGIEREEWIRQITEDPLMKKLQINPSYWFEKEDVWEGMFPTKATVDVMTMKIGIRKQNLDPGTVVLDVGKIFLYKQEGKNTMEPMIVTQINVSASFFP